MRKYGISLSAALAALLLAAASAGAAYPERPVRMIVGQAAGGASDIIARVYAQALAAELGQHVVVDNRSGAGGIIGAQLVAQAAPDGYTLLLGTNGPIAIVPQMMEKVGYDTTRDFAPVALFSQVPYITVVHPSVQANTLGELVALAKARPGQLQFGSSGLGGTPHLCVELLKALTGIDMLHVPFRGGAPAQTDLIAGRVQVYCAGFPGLLPHVRSGKLRALAITAPERSKLMPQLPTSAQAGVPGFEVNAWNGVLAPAKTPASVIARLYEATVKLSSRTDYEKDLEARGVEKLVLGPKEFTTYIRIESEKWRKVVAAGKVRGG